MIKVGERFQSETGNIFRVENVQDAGKVGGQWLYVVRENGPLENSDPYRFHSSQVAMMKKLDAITQGDQS
jgi:hypothetical protein